MRRVPLGEVATVERRSVDPQALPADTPYLGLEHIEPEGRIVGYDTAGGAGLKSTKFLFTPEHVLLGKLRPNLGKIGRPDRAGVCSTDIFPIRPGKHLDRGYLAHYLAQPRVVAYAASRATGANLPRLSVAAVAGFTIPLPSLREQRRIAAILDHADALRAKRRQVLAHLDSLTQAIFHEMFGHESTTRRFAECVSGFRYGTSKKAGPDGVPTLRIPNVIDGVIDPTNVKTVELSGGELDRLALRDGDLLFVRTNGNVDHVGRAMVFRDEEIFGVEWKNARWAYASYLIRARLDGSVDPNFIAAYFASPRGRQGLRRESRTSAGQYNINIQGVGSVSIPAVPLERQREFSRAAASVNARRDVQVRGLAALDELFASLQSRAFRGEL